MLHCCCSPHRQYLLGLPVGPGDATPGHLGMSGQLLVLERGRPVRTFGCAVAFDDGGPRPSIRRPAHVRGLAVSIRWCRLAARDRSHRPRRVRRRFRRRTVSTPGCGCVAPDSERALLDQSLISRCREHLRRRGPLAGEAALRPCDRNDARRPDTARLLGAVREVMGSALEQGGTSFDSLYVNVNGESGYFDRSLAVYGQGGEPCPRCGTPIRRESFMNRSSYFCPHCQPRPRHPHW